MTIESPGFQVGARVRVAKPAGQKYQTRLNETGVVRYVGTPQRSVVASASRPEQVCEDCLVQFDKDGSEAWFWAYELELA